MIHAGVQLQAVTGEGRQVLSYSTHESYGMEMNMDILYSTVHKDQFTYSNSLIPRARPASQAPSPQSPLK